MSKTIISRVYTVSKEVATAFVNAVSAKSLPVQVCVGIPFKDGNGQTATVTSDRPFVCGGEMCVRIKFGHSINGQTYSCADLTLNKQRSTLAQLIDSINLIGEDVDVYVDGIDGIAVCPPVSLTPEAAETFFGRIDPTR